MIFRYFAKSLGLRTVGQTQVASAIAIQLTVLFISRCLSAAASRFFWMFPDFSCWPFIRSFSLFTSLSLISSGLRIRRRRSDPEADGLRLRCDQSAPSELSWTLVQRDVLPPRPTGKVVKDAEVQKLRCSTTYLRELRGLSPPLSSTLSPTIHPQFNCCWRVQ